ncbi:MAG: N-acetylmuramoyl-L-alanine amidase [Candidatus Cryptobacteroides sp.]
MALIKYLVLHCTATPEGREVSSEEIRRWHTSPPPIGRGWKQVGYTDMVHLDGSVERLVVNNEDMNVDSWEITNGVAGQNLISRHIVYVGGCDKNMEPRDTRTEAQKKAMADYVKDFHRRFPDVRIVGHRDFPNVSKSCPSFDVSSWLHSIGIKQ